MGVDELECEYSQPASDNNNNNNNDLIQTTTASIQERIGGQTGANILLCPARGGEKQPITPTTTHVRPFAPAGAASQRPRHQQLTTFVGCCPTNNNNNKPNITNHVLQVSTSVQDLNDDRPASSGSGSSIINLGAKNFAGSKKSGRLVDSKQQHQIINHSLESIDSRYSTSSATNEDSQQHQQQHRHAAVSSAAVAALAGCSPIEAQLAASTCDLGINLDNSWPGPAQAGHPTRLSMALMNLGGGGGSGPRIRASESPLPAKSPAGAGPASEQGQRGGQQDAGTPAAAAVIRRATNEPPFMFAGVLASITGSLFFSLSVLCIKLLPNQEGFTEKVKALCMRGVFVSILCGSAILIRRSTFLVRRDELLVNTLRAIFGTCGVLGLYCAISYISIGDATALIFSSPIWTSILSHFILGEPLQWLQLLALPASLFGIVLIAHPALIVDIGPHSALISHHSELLLLDEANNSNNNNNNLTTTAATLFASGNQTALLAESSSLLAAAAASSGSSGGGSQPQAANVFDFEHRWPGIVIALGTSLLVSCTYIVLKFRKTTPIQTTTFWFGVCMILASIILQASTGWMEIPWTPYEWLLLFGNGLTSWLGQSFLQWAFLYEEAGVLSIVRTLDVAMTFVLSALFLEEEILWTSIVGATIIGLVVVSIMLNEWIKKLTRASNQRKQSSASVVVAAAAASKELELHPQPDCKTATLKQLDCLSLDQRPDDDQDDNRDHDRWRGRRSRQSAYTVEAKA